MRTPRTMWFTGRARPALGALAFLLAVALFVIPWAPASPRTYQGFPRALVFLEHSPADSSGSAVVSDDRAVVGSNGEPTRLHLVTSESDFGAEFTVRVDHTRTASTWREVGLEATPPAAARSLVLHAGVDGPAVLLVRDLRVTTADGRTLLTGFDDPRSWSLVGGATIEESGAPDGGRTLKLSEAGAGTTQASSRIVALAPGARSVTISGRVLFSAFARPFKLAIEWLDARGRHIAYAADWKEWGLSVPEEQFAVKLWHPRHSSSAGIYWSSDGTVQALVGRVGQPPPAVSDLTRFQPGDSFRVRVRYSRTDGAELAVSRDGQTWQAFTHAASPGDELFHEPWVNLSLEATATRGGEIYADVSDYALTIPSLTRYALSSDDPRMTAVALLLAAASLLWLGWLGVASAWRSSLARLPTIPVTRSATLLTVGAMAVGLALYVVAAQADGHPFDRLSQESWMYILDRLGPGDLYGRSGAVPDAAVRGQAAPWAAAAIPYGPVAFYGYWLLSTVWRAFGAVPEPLTSAVFQTYWKTALAAPAILVALAVAIVGVSRFGWSRRLAMIAAAGYALNPAVIFGNATWGQTDGVLDLFLVGSAVAVLANLPEVGLTLLGLAILAKQTALLFAAPLLVVLFARCGVGRALLAASRSFVVISLLLVPFFLIGYHPATVYQPIVQKVVDAGTSLTAYPTQISGDSFSLWTLVAGMGGLSGEARRATSDSSAVLGPLTYHQAGLLVIVIVGIAALWSIALRRASWVPQSEQAAYLLMPVALYLLMTFGTRSVGKYLMLGFPFLLLAAPAERKIALALAGYSLVTLVSEYGLFMWIAAQGEWLFRGLGGPDSNPINALFLALYRGDAGIVVLSALVVAATILYGLAYRDLAIRSSDARPNFARRRDALAGVSLAIVLAVATAAAALRWF